MRDAADVAAPPYIRVEDNLTWWTTRRRPSPCPPSVTSELGLSAVIEEQDGTKSYWALAHPDGPPDFHDPACFAASLSPIA